MLLGLHGDRRSSGWLDIGAHAGGAVVFTPVHGRGVSLDRVSDFFFLCSGFRLESDVGRLGGRIRRSVLRAVILEVYGPKRRRCVSRRG